MLHFNPQTPFLAVLSAAALLTACTDGGKASLDSASSVFNSRAASPWEQPVPRAQCGPGARPETGLQGQVPQADRDSGRSEQGYQCNLERIGHYPGEGASWQHTWYDKCAYYGTAQGAGQQNPGTVVVDVADPFNPVATTFLDSPAMLDPWESLKVNQDRGLLGGVYNTGAGASGAVTAFDVYDVTGDCTQPRLMASLNDPRVPGHEGNWAPDGHTYFGTGLAEISFIGVDDPANPQVLGAMPWPTHGLSISDDGSRGYLAQYTLGNATGGAGANGNGLAIFDYSSIQARAPVPTPTLISTLYWDDGTAAQHTIPVTIGGTPMVIFVDELGPGGLSGAASACGTGLSPFGMARIIDISDETAPTLVAKLMLEIHDPAYCGETAAEVADTGTFGYDTHYCSVDRRDEPSILACGHMEAGIRVFDIRDPYRPREVAYFNPPAQLDKVIPGSNHAGIKSADWCSANVRAIAERGELWTTCQDGGFMVLRFTNGVWPFQD